MCVLVSIRGNKVKLKENQVIELTSLAKCSQKMTLLAYRYLFLKKLKKLKNVIEFDR